MSVKITPLFDHVVIEPKTAEETSASGIVIPDTASKDNPQQGTVVAVGPGKQEDGKLMPMEIKVGDLVLFKSYATTSVKIDGQDLLVTTQSDILATL